MRFSFSSFRLVIFVLLVGLPNLRFLCAQIVDLPLAWQEMVELWNETAESTISIEDVEEVFEWFSVHPIDLNDTVDDGLQQLFFVSPFQCAAVHAYIEQYGAFLSVEELLLVPGFDESMVSLLRPIVRIGVVESSSKLLWSDLWKKGNHNLIMGANGIVERARGYRENIYEGSPYRFYWRYRYRAGNHVQLQFSADKDAGEALFAHSQQQGFDHYGFHLLISDVGKLRRFIVGDFNLQFGQGATLWSGFAPYSTLGSLGFRSSRGVVPASAFAEYGYLSGFATTVSLSKPWEVTVFLAYTPLDATVPSSLIGEIREGLPLVQSIYLSGYHRSKTEISKRHQLDELLYGTHIRYHNPNLRIGFTGYRMKLNKFVQPREDRYNYYYFRGYENVNLGLDATYRYGNLLTFGEVAFSQNRCMAGVAGMDYFYGASNRLGFSFHHYDARYWNLHADAPSLGGYTRNEDGVTLTATATLPARIYTESAVSWCRYPEMRSTAYGPSHVFVFRTRLSRHFSQSFSTTFLYQFKRQDANVKIDTDYFLFPSRRHQCQLDLRYDATAWHYGLRMAWVGYQLYEDCSRGWLVHGDVKWSPISVPLSLSFRMSLYDVNDYDARIYAVESGVAFDNSGIFYYHRGVRCYAVLHYDISRWFSLAFKYSINHYLDGNLFGSGYDALNTKHRHQWHIQLQLKL